MYTALCGIALLKVMSDFLILKGRNYIEITNSKIRVSQSFKNKGGGKDLFQTEETESLKPLKQEELGKLEEKKSCVWKEESRGGERHEITREWKGD